MFPSFRPLPMGRRKLIQRDSLEEWKKSNEQGDDDDMILEPKTGAIGRMMEEDIHA